MDIKKLVGKRIQNYRKLRNYTQEQLAELIDIDTISLSKIETGRNYPTAENLSKIAEILGVDAYEFYVPDKGKSNKELLDDIYSGIEDISADNQKLHVLYATLLNLRK